MEPCSFSGTVSFIDFPPADTFNGRDIGVTGSIPCSGEVVSRHPADWCKTSAVMLPAALAGVHFEQGSWCAIAANGRIFRGKEVAADRRRHRPSTTATSLPALWPARSCHGTTSERTVPRSWRPDARPEV